MSLKITLFIWLIWVFVVLDEMDCGVEQIDGPARTLSPSCEQRDAGREGDGGADTTRRGDPRRPRIKLPQRSDMICGFASLKGQKICKLFYFYYLLNMDLFVKSGNEMFSRDVYQCCCNFILN